MIVALSTIRKIYSANKLDISNTKYETFMCLAYGQVCKVQQSQTLNGNDVLIQVLPLNGYFLYFQYKDGSISRSVEVANYRMPLHLQENLTEYVANVEEL